MQNAYDERKNGSLKRELLNAYLYYRLQDVRILCEQWRVVNENPLQVEESRLVDKIIEKLNDQNTNPLVLN